MRTLRGPPLDRQRVRRDEHGWPDAPPLTGAERAAVAAWQVAPEKIDSDDTRTAETIRPLHSDDVVTGTLHARWLNSEVRRLLGRRIDAVERVAAALLEHGSLGGRYVRSLFAG